MNDVYEGCMLIGNRFNQKYKNEITEEWNASEECSMVAKLTYEMMKVLNISMEMALEAVIDTVLDFGFREVESHMWDDYCRGFIAGQILGLPTKENLEKANKADQLWFEDDGTKYGYYQEVLEEVK